VTRIRFTREGLNCIKSPFFHDLLRKIGKGLFTIVKTPGELYVTLALMLNKVSKTVILNPFEWFLNGFQSFGGSHEEGWDKGECGFKIIYVITNTAPLKEPRCAYRSPNT
jgi:hypothetical protein